MIKILIVANQRDCYKNDGSGVILWDFLEWLVDAGCAVQFLSASKISQRGHASRLPAAIIPAGVTEVLPGYCRSSDGWISLSVGVWLKKIARRLGLSLKSPGAGYRYDQILAMDDALSIERAIREETIDVVIADYVWCAPIFKVMTANIRKGVITHDIMASRINSFRASGLEPDISDEVALREAELLELADFALVETRDDQKFLEKNIPKLDTFLMPRTMQVRIGRGAPVPTQVLFVGGIALHNIQGISWFLEKVWPRILIQCPEAKLKILGSIVSKLNGGFRGVELIGPVEELEPYYHESAVCIIPLLSGSGLKTKLIEAMGFGKACVSTSTGAAGLEQNSKTPVIIKDDEIGFAKAVTEFLTNENTRRVYEERSALYAREHFGSEMVYRPILEYFKSSV